uniref:Uncharacterized protein n=1 Tax=Arundo donax TaxID=35708 RepID=A0A0A8ZX61_ARUDO
MQAAPAMLGRGELGGLDDASCSSRMEHDRGIYVPACMSFREGRCTCMVSAYTRVILGLKLHRCKLRQRVQMTTVPAIHPCTARDMEHITSVGVDVDCTRVSSGGDGIVTTQIVSSPTTLLTANPPILSTTSASGRPMHAT